MPTALLSETLGIYKTANQSRASLFKAPIHSYYCMANEVRIPVPAGHKKFLTK